MLGELVAGGSTHSAQLYHIKSHFCTVFQRNRVIVTRIITSYSYGAELISICV